MIIIFSIVIILNPYEFFNYMTHEILYKNNLICFYNITNNIIILNYQ